MGAPYRLFNAHAQAPAQMKMEAGACGWALNEPPTAINQNAEVVLESSLSSSFADFRGQIDIGPRAHLGINLGFQDSPKPKARRPMRWNLSQDSCHC